MLTDRADPAVAAALATVAPFIDPKAIREIACRLGGLPPDEMHAAAREMARELIAILVADSPDIADIAPGMVFAAIEGAFGLLVAGGSHLAGRC